MNEKIMEIHQAYFTTEELNKIINAQLFKEYIESMGFNPERYNRMLELNQDVLGSLLILLKKYPHFLLSTKVNYTELQDNGMDGANGFVAKDGIFVPKILENDKYLRHKIFPSFNQWYEFPNIAEGCCEYGVTISNGISEADRFNLIVQSEMDIFLGDILDTYEEDYQKKRKQLLDRLDQIRDKDTGLKLSFDCDSKQGKECILLSRRK